MENGDPVVSVYTDSVRRGLSGFLRSSEVKDEWRCACCYKMQPAGSVVAMVPDGVRRTDPISVWVQAALKGAFNGPSSGWCVKCVPGPAGTRQPPSLLARIVAFFRNVDGVQP